jgi:hypothetical protein
MGLESWMGSVVANEISPVLRGHFNAYPLETVPSQPNNGAPRWWDNLWTTAELFEAIRATGDEDLIIQANHPGSDGSGLFKYASYDTEQGVIKNPERWSEDFQAMELLNDGEVDENLPFYLDLTNRGFEVVPVGVSDSHTHRNGVGENLTWLYFADWFEGIEDYTPRRLSAAMRAGGTVVSHGPFISVRSGGAWASGATLTGQPTLHVSIEAPSWVLVDTVALWENGIEVETWTVDDPTAVVKWANDVELGGDEDAWYAIVATGVEDMSPVYPGERPWAMTAAIRVDRDDDGWRSSLPALTVNE